MRIKKRTNKFYDTKRFGNPQIRVYHKKATGKQSARYLLKCGCCDSKLEIYYGDDDILEIGGVCGSVEDWREIILPLLYIDQKKGKFVPRKIPRPLCKNRKGA